MTDELEELRKSLAKIREEAKGILGDYSQTQTLSAITDPYHEQPNLRAAHIDDSGCDEDVSFRRVEIPGWFETDPQHESFSEPKMDINALLYTMMDLIDELAHCADPAAVKENHVELLEKTRVCAENYRAVSQRYWPDTENNEIAKHLFEELKIEIEGMRGEPTPEPSTQP